VVVVVGVVAQKFSIKLLKSRKRRSLNRAAKQRQKKEGGGCLRGRGRKEGRFQALVVGLEGANTRGRVALFSNFKRLFKAASLKLHSLNT